MYKIQGLKASGREVNKIYDDLNIARFEFECMQQNNISKYLVLHEVENDNLKQIDLYINN